MAQESSFVIRESGPEAIVRARGLRIGIESSESVEWTWFAGFRALMFHCASS